MRFLPIYLDATRAAQRSAVRHDARPESEREAKPRARGLRALHLRLALRTASADG
jgi:hypothetical protein